MTSTSVTITDNDTAGVRVSPATLMVAEGGSASYTVVLTSKPSGNVTVTPSRTGSTDVTVSHDAADVHDGELVDGADGDGRRRPRTPMR